METVNLEFTKDELDRLLSGLVVYEASSPSAKAEGKEAHVALVDKICDAIEELDEDEE
jgi:hypothetical protein